MFRKRSIFYHLTLVLCFWFSNMPCTLTCTYHVEKPKIHTYIFSFTLTWSIRRYVRCFVCWTPHCDWRCLSDSSSIQTQSGSSQTHLETPWWLTPRRFLCLLSLSNFCLSVWTLRNKMQPAVTSLLHKTVLIRDHDPRTQGYTGVPREACLSTSSTPPDELLFVIVRSESFFC